MEVVVIKAEKNNSALYALHLILVKAMFLVLKKRVTRDVLLDYAEAMPRMFLSEEDETDTYRDCLAGLSDRFPYLPVYPRKI